MIHLTRVVYRRITKYQHPCSNSRATLQSALGAVATGLRPTDKERPRAVQRARVKRLLQDANLERTLNIVGFQRGEKLGWKGL
jgi:hypothetical protein